MRKVWLGGRSRDGVRALHQNEKIRDLTDRLWASVTTVASLGMPAGWSAYQVPAKHFPFFRFGVEPSDTDSRSLQWEGRRDA